MNEKSFKAYKNILIYDISYKIFMGSKPLIIGFDEINGFIRIYYGIRYLVLFCSGLYDVIYDKIKYLISKKGYVTISINHNFARIRIDSYNSLPIESTLTIHNIIILIKSVVNKNQND